MFFRKICSYALTPYTKLCIFKQDPYNRPAGQRNNHMATKITMETLKNMTPAELKNLKEAGDEITKAMHHISTMLYRHADEDTRAFEGDIMDRLFCKLYENDNSAEVDEINQWLVSHKF